MSTNESNIMIGHLTARRNHASEKALRDIDGLMGHLTNLRQSVVAWSGEQPALAPEPYGNAFGDAITAVAAFRVAAEDLALLKSEAES